MQHRREETEVSILAALGALGTLAAQGTLVALGDLAAQGTLTVVEMLDFPFVHLEIAVGGIHPLVLVSQHLLDQHSLLLPKS